MAFAWLNGSLQQPEMVDVDVGGFKLQPFMNSLGPVPLTRVNNVPTADLGNTANSLDGALLQYPPRYRPPDPLFVPKRGPIYNVPVEILTKILQLVASPCTRNGLYDLFMLTHVCRFWRVALINQPRLWSAVSITQRDRRSFVETCLERSLPVTLDVTVEARKLGRIHLNCTCDKGARQRLMPNESNPCEWHFQFELLAEPKHSNRIRGLDVEFDNDWAFVTGKAQFALGSCRFFTSTFPRLVTLTWKGEGTAHAGYLFSTPPFVPSLRTLTYIGGWNNLITQVTNLTSFSFEFDMDSMPSTINTEAFRLLMSNNRSLESLNLKWLELEGDSKGSPVYLLKLKSLTLNQPSKKLSTIIRIPAFQRLTSLRISLGDDADGDVYTLYATGDDITITTSCSLGNFAETWEDLTGYAKPTIRHIRLYDGSEHVEHFGWGDDNSTVALLMMDCQTLEVGFNYLLGWYKDFWEDLKQLGAQLKTVRFEVSEDMEPCRGYNCTHDECFMWEPIEDLVKFRFDQGRPFSVVERLVVSDNDRENRLQAFSWRCFYGIRKIDQYVRPEKV